MEFINPTSDTCIYINPDTSIKGGRRYYNNWKSLYVSSDIHPMIAHMNLVIGGQTVISWNRTQLQEEKNLLTQVLPLSSVILQPINLSFDLLPEAYSDVIKSYYEPISPSDTPHNILRKTQYSKEINPEINFITPKIAIFYTDEPQDPGFETFTYPVPQTVRIEKVGLCPFLSKLTVRNDDGQTGTINNYITFKDGFAKLEFMNDHCLQFLQE